MSFFVYFSLLPALVFIHLLLAAFPLRNPLVYISGARAHNASEWKHLQNFFVLFPNFWNTCFVSVSTAMNSATHLARTTVLQWNVYHWLSLMPPLDLLFFLSAAPLWVQSPALGSNIDKECVRGHRSGFKPMDESRSFQQRLAIMEVHSVIWKRLKTNYLLFSWISRRSLLLLTLILTMHHCLSG